MEFVVVKTDAPLWARTLGFCYCLNVENVSRPLKRQNSTYKILVFKRWAFINTLPLFLEMLILFVLLFILEVMSV